MNQRQMVKAAKEAQMAALGFEAALKLRDSLYDNWTEACSTLNAFSAQYPKGAMNLTPDYVRAMPEYKLLKSACANLESTYKAFADVFNRVYKKEYAAHVRARRAARFTPLQQND